MRPLQPLDIARWPSSCSTTPVTWSRRNGRTVRACFGSMSQPARRGPRSRSRVHRAECSESERASNPNFFVSLASTAHGRFLPQTGAVLIKNATGVIVGVAGVLGGTGDEDEEICIAGVTAGRPRSGLSIRSNNSRNVSAGTGRETGSPARTRTRASTTSANSRSVRHPRRWPSCRDRGPE